VPKPPADAGDPARLERSRAVVEQSHCDVCHRPDNKLYFNIGAPCNICMPSDKHAQIRRINLDGSGAEVVARGIRQIVGMDWHPTMKVLYFTENQRDWLSEDQPNDKLNRLPHPGQDNFGFPYCDGGDIPDPQFGWGHSCNEFTKPIAQLGPQFRTPCAL
jgi:glucose/arabinose dehydrogenase